MIKIVEAWGTMTYVDATTHDELYVESDSHLQDYWVVEYNPEKKEIIDWVRKFQSEEAAKAYMENLSVEIGE